MTTNHVSDYDPPSKRTLWIGRVLSFLPGLMLLFSASFKFTTSPDTEEGLAHLGLPATLMPTIGTLEIACAVLYLIPRTSVLGAILVTGYLGGAILTHLRVGDPCYAQVILGVMVWAGLYLREPRLRALIPLKNNLPSRS
jgi:hypothetical protein